MMSSVLTPAGSFKRPPARDMAISTVLRRVLVPSSSDVQLAGLRQAKSVTRCLGRGRLAAPRLATQPPSELDRVDQLAAAATLECFSLTQPSSRRWPDLTFISIDLLEICITRVSPLTSSRRIAPVSEATGFMM